MRFLAQKRGVIFNFFQKFPKISKVLLRFSDFLGSFRQFFGRRKSGKTIREFTLGGNSTKRASYFLRETCYSDKR
jgi:hypothetical protein